MAASRRRTVAGAPGQPAVQAVTVAQSAGSGLSPVAAHQSVNNAQSAPYPFRVLGDSTLPVTVDMAGLVTGQVSGRHCRPGVRTPGRHLCGTPPPPPPSTPSPTNSSATTGPWKLLGSTNTAPPVTNDSPGTSAENTDPSSSRSESAIGADASSSTARRCHQRVRAPTQ